MGSNENLFHKLLGLPEKLESPNYFEMLEVFEGDVNGPQVEEQYKKQIQKVQRFTNNPKYKEAALFIKGELRKARGALIDETRRTEYGRELLQSRTQEIRTTIKPLLIKGYLVEQEYQYLSQEALRMRVPEAVIQQVIKQELEKKGIDPTQAIVESDGQVGKGRSVVSGPGPGAKKKHTAPKTLGARFRWIRYLHPSELFTVDTAMALATSPLWMLGLKRYPPRHGQPVAGGLVFHAPFLAALILMTGIGFATIPYGGDLDLLGYKAEADFTRQQLAAREREMGEIVAAKVKAEDEVKRLKDRLAAGGGGSVDGPSSEEVAKLKTDLQDVKAKLASAGDNAQLVAAQHKVQLDQERVARETEVGKLKREIESLQASNDVKAYLDLEKSFKEKRAELALAIKEIEQLKAAVGSGAGSGTASGSGDEGLRVRIEELSKKLDAEQLKCKGLESEAKAAKEEARGAKDEFRMLRSSLLEGLNKVDRIRAPTTIVGYVRNVSERTKDQPQAVVLGLASEFNKKSAPGDAYKVVRVSISVVTELDPTSDDWKTWEPKEGAEEPVKNNDLVVLCTRK